MRTGALLALLTALFAAIGYWLGGTEGMIIALMAAAVVNFASYWASDRLVLSMYGAQEMNASVAPEVFAIVGDLARRAALPMPRLYLVEAGQPNAFATGRSPKHAAIAVTRALLETLPRNEIAGVLAHELAHIKHYDTLTMTIAATLAGAVGMLANFFFFFSGGRSHDRDHGLGIVGTLLLMLLAPLAATLVQLAVSRTREYAADAEGAILTGQPLWLAQALAHLHTTTTRVANPIAEHNPSTAHLFIVNPLGAGALANLFATHPPVEERIARLTAMARTVSPWT